MFKLLNKYISDRARRVIESIKTNPNCSKNIFRKVVFKDLFNRREIIPSTIKLAIYTWIVRLEILEDNILLSHW